VGPDYARLSDAELLDTADCDAFAVVYDRHVGALFSWARARVGDHAADLTAEVFARAWLRRRKFRDQADGSALPWLYGIAHNVLRDSLRRSRIEDRARARLGLPTAVGQDTAYDAVDGRLSLPDAAVRALASYPRASASCSSSGSCRSARIRRSPTGCGAPLRRLGSGSRARYDG
jgi:RNA polymerase sigma-70 factor (ECF subfamily)